MRSTGDLLSVSRADAWAACQCGRPSAALAGVGGSALEIFHVFDQRLLVLITEATPIGVSPVFDEVGAYVHFEQLGHHSLAGHGLGIPLQLRELLPRGAPQNSIHARFQNPLDVIRIAVRSSVD